MCSGRVSRSCSISGTRRFNLNTKPVISHKWTGKCLRQVEITCKKRWYPCVTFHLYFFLFTMRKYVRSLLTNLSFLSFVFSFLLIWWLFSDQHYYFTWKTRPTSVHCFHRQSSFSQSKSLLELSQFSRLWRLLRLQMGFLSKTDLKDI